MDEYERVYPHGVTTGPSLGLDDMLVRVSPECPTGISGLDDEECVTGTSDPGLGERITQTLNVCSVRNLGLEVCRLDDATSKSKTNVCVCLTSIRKPSQLLHSV